MRARATVWVCRAGCFRSRSSPVLTNLSMSAYTSSNCFLSSSRVATNAIMHTIRKRAICVLGNRGACATSSPCPTRQVTVTSAWWAWRTICTPCRHYSAPHGSDTRHTTLSGSDEVPALDVTVEALGASSMQNVSPDVCTTTDRGKEALHDSGTSRLHHHAHGASQHEECCYPYTAVVQKKRDLYYSFTHLLYDRRVCYRDDVLLQALMPARDALTTALLARLPHSVVSEDVDDCRDEACAKTHRITATYAPLTRQRVHKLAHAWLSNASNSSVNGLPAVNRPRASTNESVATDGRNVCGEDLRCTDKDRPVSDDSPSMSDFYDLLLCSSLVQRDADVRTVLQVMQAHPDTHPTVHTFLAILVSVPCLARRLPTPQPSSSTSGSSSSDGSTSSRNESHAAELDRRLVGELAGYYFGHALSSTDLMSHRDATLRNSHSACAADELWSALCALSAVAQVAPPLMDLWWGKLLDFYATSAEPIPLSHSVVRAAKNSAQRAGQASCNEAEVDVASGNASLSSHSSLPYGCVHAALAWASANRDMERALGFFHQANQRGVHVRQRVAVVHRYDGAKVDVSCVYMQAGDLTRRCAKPHSSAQSAPACSQHDEDKLLTTRQSLQLALLAKLMSTAKSIKMDGGLRELVVGDVRRLIDVAVLRQAPWGVVNDLMSGLSMPSAMKLLQLRSDNSSSSNRDCDYTSEKTRNNIAAGEGVGTAKDVPFSKKETDPSHDVHSDVNATAADNSTMRELLGREQRVHDADARVCQEPVPFMIWASLLRRCARDHHIDEAEALFKFICHVFPCSGREKHELVEIMMRMYATLPVPDYTSAGGLFLDHVVRAPAGAPVIKADVALYNILIRAADSRNAAMMTFMEGCADGVGFNRETFDALLSSNPYGAVTRLSRKLPHDYPSSILDAQLRIPANVDAHMRREDALRARGKPLYDSTGDAAS